MADYAIHIGGRNALAPWRPAAGVSAAIGYAKGAHPTGNAVIEELSPSYQSWAVTSGSNAPWAGTTNKGMNTITDWCGGAWAETASMFISMGGGHVDMCITAPYAYRTSSLDYVWLAQPLPTNAQNN